MPKLEQKTPDGDWVEYPEKDKSNFVVAYSGAMNSEHGKIRCTCNSSAFSYMFFARIIDGPYEHMIELKCANCGEVYMANDITIYPER